ncbi:MAG: DUF6512 family protein [Clostridiales bacterium]|nr:DUF6512 family protein [Clostridiales bacterium]
MVEKQERLDWYGLLERDWKLMALTALLGVGLHFAFQVWPSIVTEFFAPVNESIWEHGKIVFWPLLLVLGLSRGRRSGGRWLLAVLIATVLVVAAGWVWHVALGGSLLMADVLIYVAGIVGAFLLAEWLPDMRGMTSVALGLTILFVALICAFTLYPPRGTLFNDPALADAWVVLTC